MAIEEHKLDSAVEEPKWWRPTPNPIPRFLSKIRLLENGCWEWIGTVHPTGYGVFTVGHGTQGYAHRWSYLFFRGNLPQGLVCDHLCRNSRCVNPDHLEVITTRENTMRGVLPETTRQRFQAQTHCKRDHAFDEANTYHHPSGRRVCKTCRREVHQGRREPRAPARVRPGRLVPVIEDRFMQRIAPQANGCWLWTGGLQASGYGRFSVGRGTDEYAHRWSYRLFVGEIAAGLVIDHLCRTLACVNPDHLEAVSPKENSRRGEAGQATGARNKAKTHCRNGHPYSGDNLYLYPNGERGCRICNREAQGRYAARQKEQSDVRA